MCQRTLLRFKYANWCLCDLVEKLTYHIYMSTARIVSSGGGESEILPTNFMFKLSENIFTHFPRAVTLCIKTEMMPCLKTILFSAVNIWYTSFLFKFDFLKSGLRRCQASPPPSLPCWCPCIFNRLDDNNTSSHRGHNSVIFPSTGLCTNITVHSCPTEKPLSFMDLEGSLPCSQEPAIRLCPEPLSHHLITLLKLWSSKIDAYLLWVFWPVCDSH